MKESKTLLSRAAKNLKTAEVVLKEEDYEAVVSRSYYAMFYAAEAALFVRGARFKSHRSVISLFGKHFVQKGIFKPELGHHLNRAFRLRLTGDYAYDTSISKAEAQETLAWARVFVGVVKGYLEKIEKEPPGGEVEDPPRRED